MRMDFLRSSINLVSGLSSKIDFTPSNHSSICSSGNSIGDDFEGVFGEYDDSDDIFQNVQINAEIFPTFSFGESSNSSFSSSPMETLINELLYQWKRDEITQNESRKNKYSIQTDDYRPKEQPPRPSPQKESIWKIEDMEPENEIATHSDKSDSDEEDHEIDEKPLKRPRSRKHSSSSSIDSFKPIKGKRRKRKNLLKPGSQLYQFILQLLDDETLRDFIRWVPLDEGVFRIINKEKVAKLWGNFKNKEEMSYDSLSRGLRHYYGQGLLMSVRKKLHYKFTKKALEEWEEIRDKESIEDDRF